VQQAVAAALEEMAGRADRPRRGRRLRRAAARADPARLARAFGRLAAATSGPERRVADAMRAHPFLVGGTDRDVTQLIEGVPGLIAKDGAEGVYAAGLPDGSAVALKIEDGGGRARPPVLVAALRTLGLSSLALDALETEDVYGGGSPVGSITAVLPA
jgi:L-asparaginase II